jgi:hypothetical protein
MRSQHTSRQEIVQTIFQAHGPGKALDAGQRILGIKKPTLVKWFDGWGERRGEGRRNGNGRSSARR